MIRLVSVLFWLSIVALWVAVMVLLPGLVLLAGIIFLGLIGLLVVVCVLVPSIFDWLFEEKPKVPTVDASLAPEKTFEERYTEEIKKRRETEEVSD